MASSLADSTGGLLRGRWMVQHRNLRSELHAYTLKENGQTPDRESGRSAENGSLTVIQ